MPCRHQADMLSGGHYVSSVVRKRYGRILSYLEARCQRSSQENTSMAIPAISNLSHCPRRREEEQARADSV